MHCRIVVITDTLAIQLFIIASLYHPDINLDIFHPFMLGYTVINILESSWLHLL